MIAGVLGWGRRQAESRMTERVRFYAVTEVEDPVTFEVSSEEYTFTSGVPARVRLSEASSRDVSAPGQVAAVDRLEVHVPMGSWPASKGTMIQVESSSSDWSLVGCRYRVLFSPPRGQVTAWRIPVEEVQ